MSYDSTLTMTDGSIIDGNTAEVSSSASSSQLDSWLFRPMVSRRSIAAKVKGPGDVRSEEAQRSPVCPLAVRRMRLRVRTFHTDCDSRPEYRRQRRHCELARIAFDAWLVVGSSKWRADARSLRKRDFAMIKPGGDAALARAPPLAVRRRRFCKNMMQ